MVDFYGINVGKYTKLLPWIRQGTRIFCLLSSTVSFILGLLLSSIHILDSSYSLKSTPLLFSKIRITASRFRETIERWIHQEFLLNCKPMLETHTFKWLDYIPSTTGQDKFSLKSPSSHKHTLFTRIGRGIKHIKQCGWVTWICL